MKPTIYTTDINESRILRSAVEVLHAIPRTGPILAMSLRVARCGAQSIVLHLESGEDVSVRRVAGETWAQAIERFNAGTESEET